MIDPAYTPTISIGESVYDSVLAMMRSAKGGRMAQLDISTHIIPVISEFYKIKSRYQFSEGFLFFLSETVTMDDFLGPERIERNRVSFVLHVASFISLLSDRGVIKERTDMVLSPRESPIPPAAKK